MRDREWTDEERIIAEMMWLSDPEAEFCFGDPCPGCDCETCCAARKTYPNQKAFKAAMKAAQAAKDRRLALLGSCS
jgi:hypothetical protein